MQIKHFEVVGLFGRSTVISVDLNSDVNIITGRNGAGKTTVLKLLWYIISGNILLALQEVAFTRCQIITDMYKCTVHRINAATCRVEFETNDVNEIFEDVHDIDEDRLLMQRTKPTAR
jgi:predicted ATP-binding protein involved in virulence